MLNPLLHAAFIDFLSFLSSLSLEFKYALIGGMTTSIWSEERFTKDIDLTISLDEKTWNSLEKHLQNSKDVTMDRVCYDVGTSIPYLVRIHFKGSMIDLIFALTEYQDQLIARAVEKEMIGQKVRVASPEDIIISKLIAGREQDLFDIKKIIQTISDLDLAYIEKWVKIWEVTDRWEKISQS